jgi:hypothetical protein
MATNLTTGVGLEVLNSGTNSNVRTSGVAVEALNSGANSNVNVSGVAVEVLSSIASTAGNVNIVAALDDGATLTAGLSSFFGLTAAFDDEAVLSAVPTVSLVFAVDFTDDAALTVNATVITPVDLAVAYTDGATLVGKATVLKPNNLKVAFTDDTALSARLVQEFRFQAAFTDETRFKTNFLKVIPPVNLAAAFSDTAKFTAAIFQPPADRGPFYAAWATEDDNVFNSSFIRNDEDVFAFEIDQNEGDFAQLTLTIKNPRVGLLAPSRKVWLWLTYYNGVVVKPLFYGRLIGIPSNIFATKVTLTFIARPRDFEEQKEALARTMRDAPYFDPLVISPDSWADPDVVLEARTELWHIDRVTGLVTTSDVLSPEDGVIELTEDDHLYGGLETSLNSVPLRRAILTCPVSFTQVASGTVSLTKSILDAWPRVDSYATMPYERSFIASYTFEGLSGDWPKPGARFGQGWTVVSGSLIDQSALSVPKQPLPAYLLQKLGYDPLSITNTTNLPATVIGTLTFVYDWSVGNAGVTGFTVTYVPIGWGVPELTLQYDANRTFTENIIIDMETDTQAVKTMPGDDEVLTLNITANSASDVTLDGSIPLTDARLNSFVATPRGQQLVQHLVLLCRANLINRSCAVNIGCQFKDFISAFDVTLRKGLLIHDHRLPGGQALGKIKKYSLSYADGKPIARVTIGSAVGYGGALTTSAGEDAYIDDDYIDDYYVRDNNVVALPSSDVAYTVPNYEPNDDGLDFVRGLSAQNVIRALWVTGGPKEQINALNTYAGKSPDMDAYGVVLQNVPTQVHADIVPIGRGPYMTDVPVVVSDLIVPKQIDLEASA